MKDFTSKEEFMVKIKSKNPKIQQLIDKESTFSIVYSKDPNNDNNGDGRKFYLVVARVSNDIRKAIKSNNNKIFVDMQAYRVVDI